MISAELSTWQALYVLIVINFNINFNQLIIFGHLLNARHSFPCWGFGSEEDKWRPCPHVVWTFIPVGSSYVGNSNYVSEWRLPSGDSWSEACDVVRMGKETCHSWSDQSQAVSGSNFETDTEKSEEEMRVTSFPRRKKEQGLESSAELVFFWGSRWRPLWLEHGRYERGTYKKQSDRQGHQPLHVFRVQRSHLVKF